MTAVEIENVLATSELHDLFEQAEQHGSLRYADLIEVLEPLQLEPLETDAVFTFYADSGAPRFVANFRLELFFCSTCRSDVAHRSPVVWGEGQCTNWHEVCPARSPSSVEEHERAGRGTNDHSPLPIARTLNVSGGAAVS